VDLLTLTSPSQYTDKEYIKANFNKHHYFDQKGQHERLKPLEKLFNLLPWQLSQYYAKDFQIKLNQLLEDNQYDLIFVFKLEPAFYFFNLPSLWKKRVVIDFDDILSDLYLNSKNGFSLKYYEQKALKEFSRVFVCSQSAAVRIPRQYQRKVGVIPNIIQAGHDRFFSMPAQLKRILFVGSLDYFPNVEGLKWFCSCIWPEFIKTYPDSTLTIVGKMQKDPNDIDDILGKPKNTDIFINVPDLSPYYKDSCLSIVPLLNGSGTRLKILESASYGRPVISTAKGMEGLDFVHGKDIYIFKDSDSFIDAYRTLITSEKYTQTAQHAFELLQERYSPKVFLSMMDQQKMFSNPCF
jgi:glycosyltransferase involved in cell wall biosynthesis